MQESKTTGEHVVGRLTGNPGTPIMIIEWTRKDKKGKCILRGLWQIVRIDEGTWLTAIAKYAPTLVWPTAKLHFVYSDEWVKLCAPGPRGELDPAYNVSYFQEGGAWQNGVTSSPVKRGDRDKSLEKGDHWMFKISEETLEPIVAPIDGDDYVHVLPDGTSIRIPAFSRNYKILEGLFERALAMNDKRLLLDRLSTLESNLESNKKIATSDEEKIKRFQAEAQRLKGAGEGEAASLWESLLTNILTERRSTWAEVETEFLLQIQLLRFRCAEFDIFTRNEMTCKGPIARIQLGTPEEVAWRSVPGVNYERTK